jgi:hypothetical protein
MRHMSRSAIGPPVSVNRYLLPNEHSVITVRMHPALAESLIMVCGGLVAARKLTSRSARQDLVWGAYLLLPLHFLHRLAAWPVTYLTVTDERMMLIHGSFSRTVAAMPMDKVTGLTLQRTVLGRLLGYGTLTVASPGRRRAFRKVRYLPYPEQLYLEISGLLCPEGMDETVSPEGGGEGTTAYDSAGPFQQE